MMAVQNPPIQFAYRKDPPKPGAWYVESFPTIVVNMRVLLGQQFGRARPVGRIGPEFGYDKKQPIGGKVAFLGYGWHVQHTDQYGVPSKHERGPFATIDAAKADCELYLNRCLLYPVTPMQAG